MSDSLPVLAAPALALAKPVTRVRRAAVLPGGCLAALRNSPSTRNGVL